LSEIIYLQSNEIKKLINKIDNITDEALIVTDIEVGMRVSEITQDFKIEMINSLLKQYLPFMLISSKYHLFYYTK